MPSELKNKELLSSWKEVAAYLGCEIRTCIRWEKDAGLPVHRVSNFPRSRVFAYKEEIDAWIKAKKGSPPTLLTQHSQRPSRARDFQKTIIFQSLSLIVAGLLLLAFFLLKELKSDILGDFHIEESSLVIMNTRGKELWRYDTGLNNLAGEVQYRESFQVRRPSLNGPYMLLPVLVIRDINADGFQEVLFSIQTDNELQEGELICFDHSGKVLWRRQTGREMRFGSTYYNSNYRIKGLDTADLYNTGKQDIIIVSVNRFQSPCQLLVLSCWGETRGEFWHFGYFSDLLMKDIDADGTTEILLAGQNNEYEKACVAVFDPRWIMGRGPHEKAFQPENLAPGTEKYYILLPKSEPDLLEFVGISSGEIDILANNNISVKTLPSDVYFELNKNFEIMEIHFSHHFQREYQSSYIAGKIKTPLDLEKCRVELRKGILYWDGERWISRPTTTNHWRLLADIVSKSTEAGDSK